MTKSKQFVFKIDDDLSAGLEQAAKTFNQSRGVVTCAALRAFLKLEAGEQRGAVVDYLTRDVPAADAAKRPKK